MKSLAFGIIFILGSSGSTLFAADTNVSCKKDGRPFGFGLSEFTLNYDEESKMATIEINHESTAYGNTYKSNSQFTDLECTSGSGFFSTNSINCNSSKVTTHFEVVGTTVNLIVKDTYTEKYDEMFFSSSECVGLDD